MRKLSILILSLLLVAACMPVGEADKPGEVDGTKTPIQKFMNSNPDLILGDCIDRVFATVQWGIEQVQQCTPQHYELYEQPLNDSPPMSVVYTGSVYSILPHGSTGGIGYSFDVDLPHGCHLLQVSGQMDMWGPVGDWWMDASYNDTELPNQAIRANGDYQYMWTIDSEALSAYTINVFLWLQFASYTADSFLTIERITVEQVDADYCK